MKIINLKFTLFILFICLSVGCGFFSRLPSDKSMEEKFRAHEADFNKLVSMMKEDAKLDGVDKTAAYLPRTETMSRPKADLSSQRMDEYRRLLEQTGVKAILRHKDGVLFGFWSGWYGIDPSNGQSKDYLYTEKPPSPLVDSLDQTNKLPQDNHQLENGVYKKIADNWYLEYSVVDD